MSDNHLTQTTTDADCQQRIPHPVHRWLTFKPFLEAEYDDYAASSASGAALCRSAALILFLLRIAGFLLPCYIMAWAISILQRRRQRQEAAALAASQVATVLQSGQQRGLQFTIAPRSPASRTQEPV